MEKERWTLVQEKVYCKDCVRWYSTGADQCEIPSCGIPTKNRFSLNKEFNKAVGERTGKVDKAGQEFIKSHIERIYSCDDKKMIYGSPSQLNVNNDCYFYKALPKCLRWLTPTARMFQC